VTRRSRRAQPATDQAVKIDPANFSDKIHNPLSSLTLTEVVVAGCSQVALTATMTFATAGRCRCDDATGWCRTTGATRIDKVFHRLADFRTK